METTRKMGTTRNLGTKSRGTEASGSKKVDIRYMTELALLIAVVLVMAFTPLGYIKTPVLDVTLITIPVAIAAIFLGPAAGAVCGCAFGLTSFYTALTAPSAMVAAFMAINPALVAVLCIIPRILEGLFCGLVFKGLRSLLKRNPLSYYIAGICCPVFNTILFMGTLVLLFYNCDFVVSLRESLGVYNPFSFIIAAVGVQALIEAVVCGLVSGFITQQLSRILKR
jgi:uncharacterized membrane protein